MKNKYLSRIELAIQFIDNNLNRRLSLEEIAKSCHFSPYHFHRIFNAYTGETVNDYVSRRRLERAANMLAYKKNLSVTEIAQATGFSSGANFARAFKLHFGVSASQLRNPDQNKDSKIGKVFSKYGKAFNPADLYPSPVTDSLTHSDSSREKIMNVDVQELEAQTVCFLTSPGGYETSAIFNTWDKLIDWARANGIADDQQKRFAICHDNPAVTPEEKCRYDAAVIVAPGTRTSSPFATSSIPAGKYAIAYYKGAPEGTNNFHMQLYGTWLPNSGFEPDHFPLMEHYLNDVRKDGFVEMKAYLKLKSL